MTSPLSESQALSNVTLISNAINGVSIIGAVSPVSPFPNTYSVDFDGINDYMSIASGFGTAYGSDTQGTISLWVKPDSVGTPAQTLFCVGNGGNSYIQVFAYSGTVRANGFIGGNQKYALITDDVVLSTSSYTHIAITHNGTEPNIWINGVDVAASYTVSTDKTPWFNNIGSPFLVRLGANTTGANNPYPGLMDEVAYFSSVVLNASQIASIYNSGIPASLTSLSPSGWWRMGDNDGGTGTTVTDQGSGGNNGTLTNGPTFSTDVP